MTSTAPLTLERTHTALRYALSPLGIDIGPEVLALWLDRRHAGRAPIPEDALRDLSTLAEQLLAEANHTTA